MTTIGCFSYLETLLTLVWLVPGELAHNSKLCGNFEVGLNESHFQETVQDIDTPKCPLTATAFSAYRLRQNGNQDNETTMLLLCWSPDLRRFAVQFVTSVDVLNLPRNPSSQILRSCHHANDTVYMRYRQLSDGEYPNLILRLNNVGSNDIKFSVALAHRRRKGGTVKRLIQFIVPNGFCETQTELRPKRSVSENGDYADISTCGEERSCFRYGDNENCGHFECRYFMSSKRINDQVEIELSAKAKGWVAVGFSSDATMAAAEVIVCLKSSGSSHGLKADTYKTTYGHNPPKRMEGENILSLTKAEMRDGYIYCKVKRNLTIPTHQELTNDWFQLYASGPVSTAGDLEKHDRTPLTSSRTVSVVQKRSVFTSSSSINIASSLHVSWLFLVVSLLCNT